MVSKQKINSMNGENIDSNLYLCKLVYSQSGAPRFDGSNLPGAVPFCAGFINGEDIEVLASFDLERLKNDPNYAEFTLTNLFHKDRIKQIHDRTFEQQEDLTYGDYVGSVVDLDGAPTVRMDTTIGGIIRKSSRINTLKEKYNATLQKCEEELVAMKLMNIEKDKQYCEKIKRDIEVLKDKKHSLESSIAADQEFIQSHQK